MSYPKRLIEVDLPIARISAHARREKSIRHGHISTLHIWWARRPLAACRAVICAALWPDPADPLCPQAFRDKAAELITAFAKKAATTKKLAETCSQESFARWEAIAKTGIPLDPADEAHQNVLRFALLDLIADFANWDNSTVPDYLETSRALTQAAHEALGGAPGTRPMVVDPFAGGGSIPLEALRIGADAFASDLNPVAVLLNKVVLEYIPKYGQPSGVGVIVFASKTTASWEAILQAVVDAGLIVTGSWPVDTEREARVSAQGQARLGSSVHLICRPRENPDGELREEVGDWRDVLAQLPGRIHEWMPRLAKEGVVGADATFSCLGPALDIFSRYRRVEKASGEEATLREYLEHVWGAVSTEALRMIFDEADAAGLEPDARLTAMWLWTPGAGTGKAGGNGNGEGPHPGPLPEGEGDVIKSTGYTLEFDAARKIAQGLGVHLEKVESVVEIKGDKARLLPVAERTKYLFGKDSTAPATTRRKKKSKQMSLFAELDEIEAAEGGATGELAGASPGSTALDRVHQAMILFGAGRGEAMKRFLVEEGVGTDARFWKLAQSLSALYPRGTDEKRWVDGVLGRKKGLGL